MKTLVLDIETTPFLAYNFQQWKVNLYPSQVVETPKVLCFAWQWHGDGNGIYFEAGDYHPERRFTDKRMAGEAWSLLDEADAVVTFNGDKFDIPHLYRLLQVNNFTPPSPFQSIDLRKTTKRALYPYQSLDWTCKELGLGNKLRNPGLEMWLACMKGDLESWAEMEQYDKHDVRLTDKLYVKQLPWIKVHPNIQLVDGRPSTACPRCGAPGPLIRQGVRHTKTRTYPRYSCRVCGAWSKGSRSIDSVQVSDAVA